MAWNPQNDPNFESVPRFEAESGSTSMTGKRRSPIVIVVLIVLLVVAVMIGGIVTLVLWGLSLFRSSDVYVGAMDRLRANPAAVEILGEPIEDGWLPQGSINISGPSGNADLAIEVSGSKGKGTLYIVAILKAGEWNYETVTLESGGERTNLLKSD